MTEPDSISPQENPLQKWAAEFQARTEATARDVADVLAPLVEGNTEAFRSIITLSGGALIASISVVQFLAAKITSPTAGWLLPVSWILFATCIITAMYAQGGLTQLRNYKMIVLDAIELVRVQEQRKGTTASSTEDVEALITTAVRKKFETVRKVHNFFRIVSGWSFMLGFVFLILFASLNLPF